MFYLLCFSLNTSAQHQKCQILEKKVKYKIGFKSVNDSNDILLQISVKPKNINREYILRLAKRLRSEYCDAEKITVIIFDDAALAQTYLSMKEYIQSKGKIVEMRGFYSFDKSSGKEGIEFSTKRGNPTDENKIDLSSSK